MRCSEFCEKTSRGTFLFGKMHLFIPPYPIPARSQRSYLMASRSRREFLEQSMFATAAALAASQMPAAVAQEAQSTSANEQLSICVMGARGRGGEHIGSYVKRKDAVITHICDVDSKVGNSRCDEIEKKTGKRPHYVEDIRKALEDKSIDCVSIATPNHWHALGAIWSIQAGKDVYVEKPVSHNVSEGRRIVEAARKYKRICQTGTQSRSNTGMKQSIEYVHSGKLGEVKVARGLCYKPRGSIGDKGTFEIPSNINYDLWCGPAPMDPLTRKQLHYDWHWMWNFGNGDLGNQGIHQMDIARWGLNVNELSQGVASYGGRFGYVDAGETPNTQVVVHDYGAKTLVFEVRGLKTDDYKGARVGVIFEGSNGYLVSPSYDSGTVFDKDGKVVESFKGGADHFGNFLSAVRSRKVEELNADILEGHLSSALCHLGNISYLLGSEAPFNSVEKSVASLNSHDNAKSTVERTLEHLAKNNVDVANGKVRVGVALKFDPKTETFPGNDAANKMLTREYRKPYVVPAAGQV
jgi:predicted dehydrogenase